MISATHKSGIQAARDRGIIGSLDDRPAIGEKGHLIGVSPELQHESIVLDGAVGTQPSRHLSKIHWPVALMDLHGVPAAQGDLRSTLARQMDKVTLFAGLAAGTWPGSSNFSLLIAPYVEGKQSPPKLVFCTHQKLNCLCGLDRPNQVNGAV